MFGRRRYNNTTAAAPTYGRRRRNNVATTAGAAPRRRRGLHFWRSGNRNVRNNYEAGYQQGYVAGEQHVQHRRASIGDKISGAFMRLQGSLTGRPGLKAAGTRRMHGTDGRGSHRAYY